jgi:hypothetical protein
MYNRSDSFTLVGKDIVGEGKGTSLLAWENELWASCVRNPWITFSLT